MKKKYAPAPCLVQKFDHTGIVVSEEVVVREKVAVRNEWTPDEEKLTHRLMCLQETGEEQYCGHCNLKNLESKILNWSIKHPEHSEYWIEAI